MNLYYERQTELLCFLNDKEIYPDLTIVIIADIFDIGYDNNGWYVREE